MDEVRITFKVICNLDWKTPPASVEERVARESVQAEADRLTARLASKLQARVDAAIERMGWEK